MISYKSININKISDNLIDDAYKKLLKNKWQFIIINSNNKKYVLTKEKSIFSIKDAKEFLKKAEEDIYYKTIFDNKEEFYKKDLNIYRKYIKRYKPLMEKELYGDKYVFGCVAVRTKNNNFITTIRGKENFLDYTIVSDVDHINHIVKVFGKKATLNAPLLSKLFENQRVKTIVHINHYFDDELPYYDYAFPGTIKDSYRNNNESFNIKYHGVIYLFDKDGNTL